MTTFTVARAAAFVGLACLASVVLGQGAEKPRAGFEVRRAEDVPAAGLTEAVVAGTKTKVYLHKEVALTGKDVADAGVDEDGRVTVTFTADGRKKFAALTEGHQGRPIALMVDGKVIAAPVVREKIADGKAVISGKFSREEAERLARSIRAR